MSLHPLAKAPFETWCKIIETSGTFALGSTCNLLKVATDVVIADVWKKFLNEEQSKSYPLILNFLGKVGFPHQCILTSEILSGLFQDLNSRIVETNQPKPTCRDYLPFHPDYYKSVENEIRSTRDLLSVWGRLKKVLPKRFKRNAPSEEASKADIVRWIQANPRAFEHIESLDFSNLSLSEIPKEILEIRMPNLRSVNFSHNNLTILPKNFGLCWGNLKLLDLIDNEISDILPELLQSCPHLRKLTLKSNPILDCPEKLAPFTNIRETYNLNR